MAALFDDGRFEVRKDEAGNLHIYHRVAVLAPQEWIDAFAGMSKKGLTPEGVADVVKLFVPDPE